MHSSDIQLYLYLHREIIYFLDIFYSDYFKKYQFIPPDMSIGEKFKELIHHYFLLEHKDKNLLKEFDDLPLLNLRVFRNIEGQFDEKIEFWKRLKSQKIIQENIEYIKNHLISENTIPDNIKILCYELKEELKEHEKQKDKLLNHGNLLKIDSKKSLLFIRNKKYNIEITSKPFIFFASLLNKRANIVSYKELAQKLKIKEYNSETRNEDFKREIQEIKRSLLDKLKVIGLTKKDISMIDSGIIAIKRLGYRFYSFSH